MSDKITKANTTQVKSGYTTKVAGNASAVFNQSTTSAKVQKQPPLPIDQNPIAEQVEKVLPRYLSQITDDIKQQNAKINFLEKENQNQKELNNVLQYKIDKVEDELKQLREVFTQTSSQLTTLNENKNQKEQNQAPVQESQKVFEAELIPMVKQAIENAENVAKTIEQQQNLISYVTNDSKQVQEDNKRFKEEMMKKISDFHENLNQSLRLATDSIAKQLNDFGVQVSQQQQQICNSQQNFDKLLNQLQNMNNPPYNQQAQVQQNMYNTQNYDHYQQPQNYPQQNDYPQSQILQPQQYVVQPQQPVTTSTLPESTRSKIKIVSHTIPQQQSQ